MSGAVIGIDTGGTFTDVTLLDPAAGRMWNVKTPSTPDDPSRGFGQGIAEVLQLSGVPASAIARVLHATTVATNLILEDKGAATAMLVTDGFKYVLEIGRQDVPRGQFLFGWVKPKRPVGPGDIFEIPGRHGPDGHELIPLDEAAVRRAARSIAAAEIDAVSIVFLHSYANPAHEQRAAEILLEEHPTALVSLSSEVMPVFREYERSMTTILNAYVMSAISHYVGKLEDRVRDRAIAAPLLLMKSSGGVTSTRTVRRRPVETALSGPAAGIVGTNFIGGQLGFQDLIGIDIGGTSADISLIHRGHPGLTSQGRIGRWPVGLPMVDLTTIGAGGGSIARVSASGLLQVGPESAGAVPGPVCYGRGGVEPTITDAHLVLGRLPPFLLDRGFDLDTAAARRAVETRVAGPLGLSVTQAAQGILDISNHNMVGATRIISVERGHDPRDFVLVPFGGAGPLHGGDLARILGIRTQLVAPAPGVLSALGLLVSSLKAEFSRTCIQRAGRADLLELGGVFGALSDEATAWLDAEAVPPASRTLLRTVSMRYENQGHELSVPWQGGVDEAGFAASVEAFHQLHTRLYSFALRHVPVEVADLRVDAIGTFAPPHLPQPPDRGTVADATTGRMQSVFAGQQADVPVVDRSRLGFGTTVHGPAILTQLDCTTWLLPGQVAEVRQLGAIVITEID